MNINEITLEQRKALPRTKLLVGDQWVEYWDKATALEYARKAFEKHDLKDWKIEFNHGDYIGQCWTYAKKFI